MSRKITEETGAFLAASPDGEEVVIRIFTEFHEGHSSSGPYRVEGIKQLRMDNGKPVNRIGKGRYRLFDSDTVLTSDDPNSP